MNLYILNTIMNHLLMLIPLYISVAFLTLLERKVLGFSQLRMGPNKSSILGILQPINDAIKLFLKNINLNYNSNKLLFIFSPMMMFFLVSTIWIIFPYKFLNMFMMSLILLVALLSVGVYPILWCGWSSNSNYSILGSIRGVAQTISYEISFSILLMVLIVMIMSLSMKKMNMNEMFMMGFMNPMMIMLLLISFIAETNRTPFDFSEGESELVSGFNIEYGSVGFVLIFLSEYTSIIIVSVFITLSLLNFTLFSIMSSCTSCLMMWLWVQIRCTFPRHRYDFLMNMAWKSFLPISLSLLMITLNFVII